MECDWHPETETYVTCTRCEKPICYRCQVQAPVGVRCPECAKPTQLPAYDLSPSVYLRSAGVSALVGVAGGILLRILALELTFILFSLLGVGVAGVGLGYLVGEAVSRVAQGKRGRGLQVIAGAGVLLAAFVGLGVLALNYPGIVLLLVAEVVAVSRLR